MPSYRRSCRPGPSLFGSLVMAIITLPFAVIGLLVRTTTMLLWLRDPHSRRRRRY